MKFFVCFLALASIVCLASADKNDKKDGQVGASYGGSSYGSAPSYGAAPSFAPAPSYAPAPSFAPAPQYSAPPCPKNYLFSCQPNLAPVPCSSGAVGGAVAAGSAGAATGGYTGAYSEYVPQYAVPMPQYVYPQYAGVPHY